MKWRMGTPPLQTNLPPMGKSLEILDALRKIRGRRVISEFRPIDLAPPFSRVTREGPRRVVRLVWVTNMEGGRREETETRKKHGRDVTSAPDTSGGPRRNSDYNASAGSFRRAVRVLTYLCFRVSARGPAGEVWCHLGGAHRHVSRAGNLSRMNS